MYIIDTRSRTSFELTDGAVIGRDPCSDIVIDDKTVSRAHAQVELGGAVVTLRDLGSRHGTYCDGTRVETATLEPGQKLRFGGVSFEVVADVASESFDPRVVPLSSLQFRPADEIWSPEALADNYERLRAVFELHRVLWLERSLDSMLQKILTTAFEILDAERGVVELFGATGAPLTVGFTRAGAVEGLSLSRSVVDEVTRDRKGVIVADAQVDARFARADSIVIEGVRSVMCVPLLHEDNVMGVIQVDSLHATHAFTTKDLALFSVIASSAAVAVHQLLAYQEVGPSQSPRAVAVEELAEDLVAVVDRIASATETLSETALDPEARHTIAAVRVSVEEAGALLERLAQVQHPADAEMPDSGRPSADRADPSDTRSS